MHLLGHNLPDHKPLKIALLTFYGLSHPLASRLLARLSIHSNALVSDLTEPQLTALSAYLSSPSTTPKPIGSEIKLSPPGGEELPTLPFAGSDKVFGGGGDLKGKGKAAQSQSQGAGAHKEDPLDELRLETEARRAMQADILHMRQVGSYRGKRHAAGYPVRGQRTQTNASSARKHNRVERRGFASYARRPSDLGITSEMGGLTKIEIPFPRPPSRASESAILSLLSRAE